MTEENISQNSPVLHVVVIGFHHKKGCQVEYSYPPLIQGNPVDSHEVPDVWRHLPSLAIPDGAHNYTQDTIFFHLPSRDGMCTTVYGVACYRQMDAKHLVNKTADVTRSTVQKSVCVLSRLPMFGLVQAKLELITHAYFEEKDFSQVSLLEDTYKNLTMSVTEGMRDASQVFVGMSVRDIVIQYKHKIVLLFKLLLLERRVLFSGAPVEKLCNTLLSLLSLLPGMIEFGLEEAACSGLGKQVSPTLHSAQIVSDEEEYLEVRYHGDSSNSLHSSRNSSVEPEASLSVNTNVSKLTSKEPESPTIPRDCEDVVLKGEVTHPVMENVSDVMDSNTKTNTQINSAINQMEEKCDKKPSSASDCDNKPDPNPEKVGQGTQTSVLKEEVSSDEKPEEKRSRSNSQMSSPPTSPGNQLVLTSNTNPLANVNFITQIEAVQTGQTLQKNDSVIDMEEYSEMLDRMEQMEDDQEQRLQSGTNPELMDDLENSSGRETFLKSRLSDSVEELDSPESIQKIDREDCFSWEEDRLFLSIDHELELSQERSNSDRNPGNDSEPRDKSPAKNDDSNPENAETKSSKDRDSSTKTSPADSSLNSSSKCDSENSRESTPELSSPTNSKAATLKSKLSTAFGNVKEKAKLKRGSSSSSTSSPVSIPMVEMSKQAYTASRLQQDDCGFPLVIFTKGCICHPYLSLQYFDLMQDVNIRSFVIGATNMLFKQKRHLTDIVIEVTEGRLDFHDRELQRVLNLTTEDLRFADIIVKAVADDKENIFLDGTEWEGGDEWLRAQFKLYLQSLLITCKKDDVKLQEDFGLLYVQAFKTTHSYRVWAGTDHPGVNNLPLGHPCHGNLGVSDLRMRLSHTMQSTERGKKINAAVVQTGKYVVQTGKAVAGGEAVEDLEVFIAHSSADGDLFNIVNHGLQERGVKTFSYLEDIKPGQEIVGAVSRGIENCNKFLMLLTENSINSPWCKLELILALEKAQRTNKVSALFLVKDLTKEKIPDVAPFKDMEQIALQFDGDDPTRWKRSQAEEVIAKLKEDKTIDSVLPAGNVAHGQAWSHFCGMFDIVLPELEEKVLEYKESVGQHVKMSSKLYELIPESCKVHSSIHDADALVQKIGKLSDIVAIRGGVKRKYSMTVYKIQHSGQEYHCVAEYPSSLGGIYDMQTSKMIHLSKHERRLQVARYFYTLSSIIKHPKMKYQNRAQLLLYNDGKDKPSEVLANAIKQDLQYENKELLQKTTGNTLNRPLAIDRLESVEPLTKQFDAYITYCDEIEDTKFASNIRDYLEKNDVKLFEEQPGGTEFRLLASALRQSRWLVLILSKAALHDGWLTMTTISLLQNTVEEQKVRVIPVLIDLSDAEIPNLLKWVTYIDSRDKRNYLERLCCAIKGDDIPMFIESHLPAGNVAHGFAWNYYINYLRFIIPGCVQQIPDFFAAVGVAEYKCPKKFFILVPDSCNCKGALSANHDCISSPFGERMIKTKREHSGTTRHFDVAVHKVTDLSDPTEYYFVGVYATAVETLNQMQRYGIAGIQESTMKAEAKQFCKILQTILGQKKETASLCKVLQFDDSNRRNLATLMIAEINRDAQEGISPCLCIETKKKQIRLWPLALITVLSVVGAIYLDTLYFDVISYNCGINVLHPVSLITYCDMLHTLCSKPKIL